MVKLSVTTSLANLIPAFNLNSLCDVSYLHDSQRSHEVLRSRALIDTHLSTDYRQARIAFYDET